MVQSLTRKKREKTRRTPVLALSFLLSFLACSAERHISFLMLRTDFSDSFGGRAFAGVGLLDRGRRGAGAFHLPPTSEMWLSGMTSL